MSLSTQLLQFLGVAFVFVGFTFAWGWYIGRRENEPIEPIETPEPEPEPDSESESESEPDSESEAAATRGEH